MVFKKSPAPRYAGVMVQVHPEKHLEMWEQHDIQKWKVKAWDTGWAWERKTRSTQTLVVQVVSLQ